MPRKVCIATGTRAEWGLLRLPAQAIRETPALELQILATGAHLSTAFGQTVRDIERDGFTIDARVPILDEREGDDALAVTKALGRGVIGCAEALARLRPDIVMILGDRYEMLAVAQAALLARIPVAHLCGGDVTEGAVDDAIRHAITKMAHIHFVTNAIAARRVRQMGEDPRHIHLVGSPGIDAILRLPRLSRKELLAELGLPERSRLLTVTFHPPTLDKRSAVEQMQELLTALDALGEEVAIILTGSNADVEGRTLTRMAKAFASARPHVAFRISLGQQRYYSALASSDAVVGNSSSGLYEAPSFKVPTVNIGDRQEGRLKAASVIDCPPRASDIVAAIRRAWTLDCSNVTNPYGDGKATERIVAVLRAIDDPQHLIRKRFVEWPMTVPSGKHE